MKKKKITRFPICRKGYDIDAVESYIALEGAKVDEAQQSQRERISALKNECDKLRSRIGELEGREEQIKHALVVATENADKLTLDVKARYRAELERLKLFRAKWVSAYEQMKERYHFDKDALNVESVAVNIEVELTKFLMQDFSLNKAVCEDEMEAHFRREIERLTKPVSKGGTSEISKEERQRNSATELCKKHSAETAENSVAFSIEEALNPTTTFAQNCQALGLVR